jgi:hypothetical protein
MKRGITETEDLRTSFCLTGFDAKCWEYVEPIFKALDQARHQVGRFRFYGYLAAVYRPYKEWKDLGISRRMARRLARRLALPTGKIPVRSEF